ncbi:integrase [Bacillus sp. RC242]|uniref:hypothetical protein n=1 Tax=unclassified Bacillus (in: firmicutes) TaxID=185979 RepID=UPI003832C4E8
MQGGRFLEHAKENRYYIAYLLAITCGMRKGEILGLQWKEIADFTCHYFNGTK